MSYDLLDLMLDNPWSIRRGRPSRKTGAKNPLWYVNIGPAWLYFLFRGWRLVGVGTRSRYKAFG